MATGEKLLVAATLEPVVQGQEFETIPPHVSDTPERKVKRGEHLAFPNVAVFSKIKGIPINHVEAVYPLSEHREV